MARSVRSIGELTFAEVSQYLKETSILCLPIGAIEQHGRHLPLNTDVTIAEEFTRRMVAQWGDEFDLWVLPTLSISLSREHDWASGTLALGIGTFVTLLKDLAREIERSLPARNLLIVNGHGGNRGILDNLMHELFAEFALNACTIHPFELAKSHTTDTDVHGGRNETSVMLAIAPHLVRREHITSSPMPANRETIAALIFDPGARFPWRSDDSRIAADGVIGDASAASADIGEAIMADAISQTGNVLRRLRENQRLGSRRPG
jgi:creatinine amidohydrolase